MELSRRDSEFFVLRCEFLDDGMVELTPLLRSQSGQTGIFVAKPGIGGIPESLPTSLLALLPDGTNSRKKAHIVLIELEAVGENAIVDRSLKGDSSSDPSRGIAASSRRTTQSGGSRAAGRLGKDHCGREHRRFHYWRRKRFQRASELAHVAPGGDASAGAAAASPCGGPTAPWRAGVRTETAGCGWTERDDWRANASRLSTDELESSVDRWPASHATARPANSARKSWIWSDEACEQVHCGGWPAPGRRPEFTNGSKFRGPSRHRPHRTASAVARDSGRRGSSSRQGGSLSVDAGVVDRERA